MKTFTLLLTLTLGCAVGSFAQNEPISLSTEVTTTYYTDGSSQSNSRMLFYVGEGSAQRMGFIGARLKPHLNQAPEVQANYKSIRAWGLASQTLALTCSATLIAAIFAEDPEPAPGQSELAAQIGHYKWGILSGVAYLTTGMIASGKLEKTIDTHNAVISPTLSSHGVGVQLQF